MPGQFMRSFSYSIDSADAVIFEDIHNVKHIVRDAATTKTVRKTVWQDDNIPLLTIGDTFISAGVSAVCTRISVSDAVDAIEGCNVLRRWKIEYEGIANLGSLQASEFRTEQEISYDLNGAVENSIDGDTVILLRSATPKKRIRITCYGTSLTPPVLPGSAFESGICIKADTSLVVVNKAGFEITRFYRYNLEVVE